MSDAVSLSHTGKRATFLAARLAYVERYGAKFLLDNTQPPVPGYPRWKMGRMEA